MTQFTPDKAVTQNGECGRLRLAYLRLGNRAYRRSGVPPRLPLVLFQHFVGAPHNYDPAVSDAFAGDREVISCHNAGVASSGGTVSDTIEATARDAASSITTSLDPRAQARSGPVASPVKTVPGRMVTSSGSGATPIHPTATRLREPDKRTTQSPGAFEQRRVLEEMRARLSEINMALAKSAIDAGELREDAHELRKVVRRIIWLADITAS
jgi:hypothetical protein